MKTNYVSSITTKFGDVAHVQQDSKTVSEILARQGSSLLLDLIAEHVGNTTNKFNLGPIEVSKLKTSLLNELREAIEERT